MTKKDFKLIAKVLECLDENTSRGDIIERFAEALKTENLNFNIDKFREACNYIPLYQKPINNKIR